MSQLNLRMLPVSFFLSLQIFTSAHLTLIRTGELALMVLIATVVCALPGLEGRTAKQVSKRWEGGGGMVLAIKGMELYF